jgi:hypothetical protein
LAKARVDIVKMSSTTEKAQRFNVGLYSHMQERFGNSWQIKLAISCSNG